MGYRVTVLQHVVSSARMFALHVLSDALLALGYGFGWHGHCLGETSSALKQLLQRGHSRHNDAYGCNRPALALGYGFDQISTCFLDLGTHRLSVAARGRLFGMQLTAAVYRSVDLFRKFCSVTVVRA